jgi:hypothetical protein
MSDTVAENKNKIKKKGVAWVLGPGNPWFSHGLWVA